MLCNRLQAGYTQVVRTYEPPKPPFDYCNTRNIYFLRRFIEASNHEHHYVHKTQFYFKKFVLALSLAGADDNICMGINPIRAFRNKIVFVTPDTSKAI